MDMMIRFRTCLAAGLFALVACVNAGEPPTGGQPREDHADRAAEQQSAKKKSDNKGRDLDSCRRDARGLDGPERARFMTECLRTRE
jgi:hypothetical protein